MFWTSALPLGWPQCSLLDAPGSAFRLARGSTDTIDLCFPALSILAHFHPSLCPQRHDAFRQDRTDRPIGYPYKSTLSSVIDLPLPPQHVVKENMAVP